MKTRIPRPAPKAVATPALLALTLLSAAAARAPSEKTGAGTVVEVAVDAGTQVFLGSQGRISRNLFGITAFEGFPRVISDLDYRARLLALRPGCIRFGGNIAWCWPASGDLAWYASPAAFREFSQCLLFGARYPLGRFLPVVRQLGAEPMVSLGSVPKPLRYKNTADPADFARWARLCTAYIGLWKRADPGLRWVQVWNEPNASWFRDPRAAGRGPAAAAELHIRMANQVAAALKARFPNLEVGGPVLCWPPAWPPNQKGMKPWYTWNAWTLPWLRRTRKTMDFFDFHVYDVAPDDFAVQVEMLAAAALRIQKRRLPIWISESNYRLSPQDRAHPTAVWERRALPYERFLFHGVLAQADKLCGNLMHDLHARAWGILPDSAEIPSPTYWLLWIFRDLGGDRVRVLSSASDLPAAATLERDRVSLVVFNDAPAARRIRLTVRMPCSYWTGPYTRLLRPDSRTGCRPSRDFPVAVHRAGGTARCDFALPARATAALDFRMNRFGGIHRRIHITERFGDRTLAFLSPGAPVIVQVPVPPPACRSGSRWFLRLGLLGAGGREHLACTWNGHGIPVRARALQQIPLAGNAVRPRNRCELRVTDAQANPRLALAFVALVQECSE